MRLIPYFETSASTGDGVQEVMQYVIDEAVARLVGCFSYVIHIGWNLGRMQQAANHNEQ
jgi:hypothetical protein